MGVFPMLELTGPRSRMPWSGGERPLRERCCATRRPTPPSCGHDGAEERVDHHEDPSRCLVVEHHRDPVLNEAASISSLPRPAAKPWGGTGDPHLQAAEEGLTTAYTSPMNAQMQDWALSQWNVSKKRTIGVYSGALGFGFNTELLAKKNLPEPKCWADLIKPDYKGEVQVANPHSSGTSYTMVASLVQIMGENSAFEYLKRLNTNVNQYTKSGAAPIVAAGRGETLIGIVFMHDAITQSVRNFPIKTVAPCEGTGYEIGSMSIINGARNAESAKKFYDWALSPEAQALGAKAESYQMPSNKATPTPPQAPKLSEIKLINYDFQKFGSSEERKRLLTKFDAEIKINN